MVALGCRRGCASRLARSVSFTPCALTVDRVSYRAKGEIRTCRAGTEGWQDTYEPSNPLSEYNSGRTFFHRFAVKECSDKPSDERSEWRRRWTSPTSHPAHSVRGRRREHTHESSQTHAFVGSQKSSIFEDHSIRGRRLPIRRNC
jgi:hypothetical protein